jgi:hypothetical protein
MHEFRFIMDYTFSRDMATLRFIKNELSEIQGILDRVQGAVQGLMVDPEFQSGTLAVSAERLRKKRENRPICDPQSLIDPSRRTRFTWNQRNTAEFIRMCDARSSSAELASHFGISEAKCLSKAKRVRAERRKNGT